MKMYPACAEAFMVSPSKLIANTAITAAGASLAAPGATPAAPPSPSGLEGLDLLDPTADDPGPEAGPGGEAG
jgi:hypothetical protein